MYWWRFLRNMPDTSKLTILETQIDEINRCFRCGLCKTVCPSYEELKIESSSPRGRIQYAKSVLDNNLPLKRAIQAKMLDCLNCMQCVEICPSGVRTDRIVLAARAELAKKGKLNFIKKIVFKTVIKYPFFMNMGAWFASIGQRLFYKDNTLLESAVPRLRVWRISISPFLLTASRSGAGRMSIHRNRVRKSCVPVISLAVPLI